MDRDNAHTVGLRSNRLSSWEAVGQSLATIAPTAGPALVIPLVLASAGNSAWLVFVIATVAIVCVGREINVFARKSSSPGSLYTFVVQGLPRASLVTGWALLFAYVGTAVAVTGGTVTYLYSLILPQAAISRTGALTITVVAVLLAAALAWRDVKVSTRLMLLLEAVSVATILLLFLLPGHGSALRFDHAQLLLTGVTLRQIRGGLVLAFFAYVGFESATSLGGEAVEPLRTIPRAVSSTILISGLFFIVSAYAEHIGFDGQSSALANSTAPLQLMAGLRGFPLFAPVLAATTVSSFFACILACIQAAARTLFMMSRDGQIAKVCGGAHPRTHSPHIAILIVSIVILVLSVALISGGGQPFDIYGWMGTFATFGFLTAYGLLTIAAMRVSLREGSFNAVSVVSATVIALVLALSAWSSFDPSIEGVYRWLPYFYLAALAAAVLMTILLRPGASATVAEPASLGEIEPS